MEELAVVDKHMGTFDTFDWATYDENLVFLDGDYNLYNLTFFLYCQPSRAYSNPSAAMERLQSTSASFLEGILSILKSIAVIFST